MALSMLPDELLMEIVINTPISELDKLCLSSSKLRDICSDDLVWKQKLEKDHMMGDKPDNMTYQQWYRDMSEFVFDPKLLRKEKEDYLFDVFEKIFARLKLMEDRRHKSGKPTKIYLSYREYDAETSFEKKSNELDLGVITNNKITASIILLFARLKEDNKVMLLNELLSGAYEDPDLPHLTNSLTDIIEKMTKAEIDSIKSHKLDQQITDGLYKDGQQLQIIKPLYDMDIWTLKRTRAEIEEISWYPLFQ